MIDILIASLCLISVSFVFAVVLAIAILAIIPVVERVWEAFDFYLNK